MPDCDSVFFAQSEKTLRHFVCRCVAAAWPRLQIHGGTHTAGIRHHPFRVNLLRPVRQIGSGARSGSVPAGGAGRHESPRRADHRLSDFHCDPGDHPDPGDHHQVVGEKTGFAGRRVVAALVKAAHNDLVFFHSIVCHLFWRDSIVAGHLTGLCYPNC